MEIMKIFVGLNQASLTMGSFTKRHFPKGFKVREAIEVRQNQLVEEADQSLACCKPYLHR